MATGRKDPQIVRLLTLGDSGTGKSSLLLRYTQNEFTREYMATIGIDFRLKTIEVKGKVVKVQIWDTAGQERFRTITHNYYRSTHGIALVYDVTKLETFQAIRKWVKDVHQYADSNVNLILVGNKCDLPNREVEKTAGQELADSYGIPFFETSAKADICVTDAFAALVHAVVGRIFASKEEQVDDKKTVKLNTQNTASGGVNKQGCC